jgi:hypothetical protein
MGITKTAEISRHIKTFTTIFLFNFSPQLINYREFKNLSLTNVKKIANWLVAMIEEFEPAFTGKF